MSTFEKAASGADKYFVALNEQRSPFVIQLLLEGEGDPDPEALHDALEATTAANPGSSLRIVKSEGTAATWVLGPPPTLTVLEDPEFEAAHGEHAPFLMWPLSATEGPSCELLSVKGKHKHYLIFRALHAVMDGQGTHAWVQDFMRCLRGEAPLGHPSPLTVDELVHRRDEVKRRPTPKEDALHPFSPARPESQGRFHWRRISAERPLESLATGKIAVAIAEHTRRDGREGIVRINLPTDLRAHCPDERTTGNLFASLFVEVPPGATPEGVGMKVIQLLYKKEGARPVGLYSTDESGSLDAFRVKVCWDLAHLHDTGRYAFSATLSHLGVLESAKLSGPGFTATSAFFVPLVGDSGCVVSLNGFDGHTEGAVGLSDRFNREGALDTLAELIRGAIS